MRQLQGLNLVEHHAHEVRGRARHRDAGRQRRRAFGQGGHEGFSHGEDDADLRVRFEMGRERREEGGAVAGQGRVLPYAAAMAGMPACPLVGRLARSLPDDDVVAEGRELAGERERRPIAAEKQHGAGFVVHRRARRRRGRGRSAGLPEGVRRG